MKLAYPFDIVNQENEYIITFPDIPEAITGGDTQEQAIDFALDALIAALGAYIDNKQEIPEPSIKTERQQVAIIPPLQAAKIALYIAMKKQGFSNEDLANRLMIDEKAVSCILDLDQVTKIETIHQVYKHLFGNNYPLVRSPEGVELS